MTQDVGTAAARRRKMFALCDRLGLSDEERIDISQTLLWRDITSWKDLTDDEVSRMLDALEGAILILATVRDRV